MSFYLTAVCLTAAAAMLVLLCLKWAEHALAKHERNADWSDYK